MPFGVQGGGRGRVGRREVTAEEKEQQALLERFTGAATAMMSHEADIFELHKEEIEHALKLQSLLTPAAGATLPRLWCPRPPSSAPSERAATHM